MEGDSCTVLANTIQLLLSFSLKQMSKKKLSYSLLKVLSVSFLFEGIKPSPQMMIY